MSGKSDLDIVQSCAFTRVAHSERLSESDAFSHVEKLLLDFSEGRGHLCRVCGRHDVTHWRAHSDITRGSQAKVWVTSSSM